jgi:hypothetical protein
MYRGIEQVQNAIKPLLAKHGVTIVPEVLEIRREVHQTKNGTNLYVTVLRVAHHFYAKDGSFVSAVTTGEGMDSADKSANKALSVAFKYACFEVFNIPTEDMALSDPDNYSPEPTLQVVPAPIPQPTPPPKRSPSAPAAAVAAQNAAPSAGTPVSKPGAILCVNCGASIKPQKGKDGVMRTSEQVSKELGGLCIACFLKAKQKAA